MDRSRELASGTGPACHVRFRRLGLEGLKVHGIDRFFTLPVNKGCSLRAFSGEVIIYSRLIATCDPV